MLRRRTLLISLAAALGLLLGTLSLPRHGVADASLAAVYDPYAVAPLRPYGSFLDAVRSGDAITLQRLAAGSDSYLAYRAALELARWRTLDAATRLAYYRRAMTLRIHDPLARDETRSLHLEAGRAAEAAGDDAAALAYYRQALPLKGAQQGLARLEPDPVKRALDLLDARLYQGALDALGSHPDPEIRARAEIDLGNYAKALPAYRQWSAQAPGDVAARQGLAWTLFYLGKYDEAERLFERLAGTSALYGRALIAEKRGQVDAAVSLLLRTGRADDLWRATTLLESKQRYADAIPLYLRLARGGTAYADDAAYRAFVLARRLGRAQTARTAAALVPNDSFFALLMGRTLQVPTPAATAAGPVGAAAALSPSRTVPTDPPGSGTPAAASTAAALSLARALNGVHDTAAAVGELMFALRALGATTDASAPPAAANDSDVVAIAQMLQSLGEYRQSVYAARLLIQRGSRSLAVWRLAYPTAYASTVERQAAAAGVSPLLVWSVMRKESAFSPVAVSRSDAMGLMQVTPPTWDWLGTLQGDATPANPFDRNANIRYGTTYLGFLMRQFHGDTALAVASYNRGQGYIGRLFDGPQVHGNMNDLYRAIDSYETREYMQAVLVDLAIYRDLYPRLAASVR